MTGGACSCPNPPNSLPEIIRVASTQIVKNFSLSAPKPQVYAKRKGRYELRGISIHVLSHHKQLPNVIPIPDVIAAPAASATQIRAQQPEKNKIPRKK